MKYASPSLNSTIDLVGTQVRRSTKILLIQLASCLTSVRGHKNYMEYASSNLESTVDMVGTQIWRLTRILHIQLEICLTIERGRRIFIQKDFFWSWVHLGELDWTRNILPGINNWDWNPIFFPPASLGVRDQISFPSLYLQWIYLPHIPHYSCWYFPQKLVQIILFSEKHI